MPQLRTSQNRAMGLTAGNLSANFSRIHPFEHVCDRGYAIPYETVSDDEAKLAIGGTRDARAIFGDKFSKSREIKDLGRQEFLYDFFMFCFKPPLVRPIRRGTGPFLKGSRRCDGP